MTVWHWLCWRKWDDFVGSLKRLPTVLSKTSAKTLSIVICLWKDCRGCLQSFSSHNSHIMNALLASEFCLLSGRTKAPCFTLTSQATIKKSSATFSVAPAKQWPYQSANCLLWTESAMNGSVALLQNALGMRWGYFHVFVKGRPEKERVWFSYSFLSFPQNCVFLLTNLTLTLLQYTNHPTSITYRHSLIAGNA